MFVPVYLVVYNLSSLCCVFNFVISLVYVVLKVRMSSLFIKGHLTCLHWRKPRRGCRGHIPQYFLWGVEREREYPPQYYYVLSDIADQYWLPSVRSASSRFHSALRRHQFASVRQADSRLTRLVPPNLELALTPLDMFTNRLKASNNTDARTVPLWLIINTQSL